MNTINLSDLTAAQRAELTAQLYAADKQAAIARQNTYAELKADLLARAKILVASAIEASRKLNDFMDSECMAFGEVMREYGALSKADQMNFTLKGDVFAMDIKSRKVKEFDERADIAAEKLVEFLDNWIQTSDKGSEDPMYQLTMMFLERNRNGKLDYKSISKLYEMETKFSDTKYTAIMDLFRESNVVEGTATNYYFRERNAKGVWVKLEPSFNRM